MGSNYMAVLPKVVCKDSWDSGEDRRVLEVLDRHRMPRLVVPAVRQRRRINRMLQRMSVYPVVAVPPYSKGDKVRVKAKAKDKDQVALRGKAFTAVTGLGTVLGDQGVEALLKQAGTISQGDLKVTLDMLRAEVNLTFTDTSQGSSRLIGSSLK